MNSIRLMVVGLVLMVVLACSDENSKPAQAATALPVVDTRDMEDPVRRRIESSFQALRASMDSAHRWGDTGRILHAHELFAAAVQCYREAMALDPERFDWPYLAAHAMAGQDVADALAMFEHAARLDGQYAPLLIAIGELQTRLGKLDEARAAFERARGVDAAAAPAVLGLARLAMLEMDLSSALELLQDARTRWPGNGQVHVLLAQLYSRMNEPDLAARAELAARVHRQEVAVPDDPVLMAVHKLAEDSRSHALRGKWFAERGALEQAEIHMRRVLEIRSGTPDDYGNLATVLARQRRFDEAFEWFEAGLRIDPDDVSLLSHLGLAQHMAGHRDAAEATLTRAVSLDPSYAAARFNLGSLRVAEGDYQSAIADFEAVLTLDPSFTHAYLNLGSSYATIGDLPKALAAWSRLRAIQPDNPALLENIARLQHRLGQAEEAAETLKALQALRAVP